ncbi:hypothetical protein X946_3964 [Burkholderia sp. ABCPW 111]|nr:hypothetical protein X946_3964 [Burkholderia sp. ABCPW 111]
MSARRVFCRAALDEPTCEPRERHAKHLLNRMRRACPRALSQVNAVAPMQGATIGRCCGSGARPRARLLTCVKFARVCGGGRGACGSARSTMRRSGATLDACGRRDPKAQCRNARGGRSRISRVCCGLASRPLRPISRSAPLGTARHRTARLSLDDAAATRRAYPIARCRGAPCRWSAHRLHSLLAALRVRRALQSAMRSAPACRARATVARRRGGDAARVSDRALQRRAMSIERPSIAFAACSASCATGASIGDAIRTGMSCPRAARFDARRRR